MCDSSSQAPKASPLWPVCFCAWGAAVVLPCSDLELLREGLDLRIFLCDPVLKLPLCEGFMCVCQTLQTIMKTGPFFLVDIHLSVPDVPRCGWFEP